MQFVYFICIILLIIIPMRCQDMIRSLSLLSVYILVKFSLPFSFFLLFSFPFSSFLFIKALQLLLDNSSLWQIQRQVKKKVFLFIYSVTHLASFCLVQAFVTCSSLFHQDQVVFLLKKKTRARVSSFLSSYLPIYLSLYLSLGVDVFLSLTQAQWGKNKD